MNDLRLWPGLAAAFALVLGCHASASTTTGSSACNSLALCCVTAGAQMATCLATANGNDTSTCTAELATLTLSGACGGVSPGSGTGSGGGVSAASCDELSSCCANLTGSSRQTCVEVVASGNLTNCAADLTAFTVANECSGVGPGSGTGIGPGSGTGIGPGSGTGIGPGSGTGVGPGSGTGIGPGSGTGVGPGSGSGTGAGDAGGVSPECTVATSAPSNGSCVTVTGLNDAGSGVQCNPVTAAGCADAGVGATCDIGSTDGTSITSFVCYPPPNTAAVCAACDNTSGPYCAPTTTCVITNESSMTTDCARYCCTNADCGSGRCMTGGFAPAPTLGICVTQ
jgi:hypothetical protein